MQIEKRRGDRRAWQALGGKKRKKKTSATEAGVLMWNPATKEPRIKHTMGMGCELRESGEHVCVFDRVNEKRN